MTDEPPRAVTEGVYVYRYGSGIYLNLTNRCSNRCDFCARYFNDYYLAGNNLRLSQEPSPEQVLEALAPILEREPPREIVFCGFGEPTANLGTLTTVAGVLALRDIPLRLNTNGQGSLINGCDIIPYLTNISCVSISLNAPDATVYERLCRPLFGERAFPAVLRFVTEAKRSFSEVRLSVVGAWLSKDELRSCEALAARFELPLRIR